MKTHKFARKPFYVDAVRVSEANIAEVAEWCGGEIITDHPDGKHLKVKVHRPITERQTMAFIGDWVLWAGNGFKVYTPKAFDKSFEKVRTLSKAQADEAGITVPHEKKSSTEGFKAKKRGPKNPGPNSVMNIARIHSASIVAEEPNPAVGVHPITLVETKVDDVQPLEQKAPAMVAEAEAVLDGGDGPAGPGCICSIDQHRAGKYRDDCPVCGAMGDPGAEEKQVTVIPPKNDPLDKMLKEFEEKK